MIRPSESLSNQGEDFQNPVLRDLEHLIETSYEDEITGDDERDEDHWENLADQYAREDEFMGISGKGGGRKKTQKQYISPTRGIQIGKEIVGMSQEQRLIEGPEAVFLKGVLESFETEQQVAKYITWVIQNSERVIKNGIITPLFSSMETKEKAVNGKVKAGGQNSNKRKTSYQMKHIPTNEQVKVGGQRSQVQNRQKAALLLQEALLEHINSWRYLKSLYTSLHPNDRDVSYQKIISDCRSLWS